MSLAYQDISKQQQKRVDKMKSMDPKKAEQAERLGMGFGMRRLVCFEEGDAISGN